MKDKNLNKEWIHPQSWICFSEKAILSLPKISHKDLKVILFTMGKYQSWLSFRKLIKSIKLHILFRKSIIIHNSMKINHTKIVIKKEFKIICTFNKMNCKISYLKKRKQKMETKCMLTCYKFSRKIKIYKTNLKIKIEVIFPGTRQSSS